MAKSTRPRTKTRVRTYSWAVHYTVFLVLTVDLFSSLLDRGTSCFEESTFRQRKGRFSNHSHKRDKDPSAAQAP